MSWQEKTVVLVSRLTAGLLVSLIPVSLPRAQVEALADIPSDFSCTAFPAGQSEADLVHRYGEENVIHSNLYGSGGPESVTVVFPQHTEVRFEVFWWNTESRDRPRAVRVQSEGSQLRTVQGIAIGDDLQSVEQANGGPFRLNGFAMENPGAIRSWGNGRLTDDEDDGCTLTIQFVVRYEIDEPTLLSQLKSRQEYSSGHPAMQGLNPRVGVLWIRYPPPDI